MVEWAGLWYNVGKSGYNMGFVHGLHKIVRVHHIGSFKRIHFLKKAEDKLRRETKGMVFLFTKRLAKILDLRCRILQCFCVCISVAI